MNEIKNFFRDYPAFAWGGVVVVLLVAFYFANKINQNNANASSSQSQIPTYILYDATQQQPAGTTGSTTGTTGSGGTTGTSAKIRNKTPVDSAGGKQTSVPVFASTNAQHSTFKIPFGQSVTITGPSVTGRTAKSMNGKFTSSTWYPVMYNGQNGFIVSYDLANPPGNTASTAATQ